MKMNSPVVRFVAALSAALLVGTLTWRAVVRTRSDSSVAGPAVRVLVLRRSVAAGKVVGAADVEGRFIPSAFVEPGALREARDLAGAHARVGLTKGEQLTRSQVETDASRLGLAWSLPPGQTALTLRLAAESAIGGHVLPGDWISVCMCAPRGAAATVLHRVRVGAVGEKIWDPVSGPGSPPAAFGANEYFLVTLVVTSEQALQLLSASERGRLTLTLLSPLDAAAGGRVRRES